MSGSINVPGYGIIEELKPDPRLFLDRSTILYGPSESGKGFILNWILNLINKYVPNWIGACPTNDVKKGLATMMEKPCLKTEIDQDIWSKVIKRQDALVKLYDEINKKENLQELCIKSNNNSYKEKESHIIRMYTNSVENLKKNEKDEKTRIKAIDSLDFTRDRALNILYKNHITKYKANILALRNDMYNKIIKYLYLNPRLGGIYDDVTDSVKKWHKFPEFDTFVTRCRWLKFTIVMTMHTPVGLTPTQRGNIFVNIFTSPNIVKAYFSRDTNGIPKEDIKAAEKICPCIFDGKGFKRLVYLKGLPKPFRYIEVAGISNVKLGSKPIHELCSKIASLSKKTNNILNSIY